MTTLKETVDKPKDGVCTQCGRDLPDVAESETLYNGSEGDHIHINENHGDIFINVGSQCYDHSTTSFLVEQKITHSHNPHPVNLSAQSAAKCPPVISSGSFQRTINLKTASGQRNHVRDYNDADTHTVNLNVAKNMGIICIGNNININITYCDGLSERHTGGHCSDSPSQ